MMNDLDKKACILFDLDDTLLDFKIAERIAVSKTFLSMGIEPSEEIVCRYSEINKAQWEKLELGLISRETVLSSRFDILFNELEIEASGFEAQLIYEKLLEQGHYFVPGAEELLNELYGRFRLYIVSNGTGSVQYSRLKSAGITELFDGIFISQEIGTEKPGKRFFDKCFERIPDFDIDKAIIIGDSLTSDIRGGINAGIKTCWFNYRNTPARDDIIPDYTIYELSALPELLTELFS